MYPTLRRGFFRKSDTSISICREFNSKFLMVVLMFSVYFHICVCVCMCVNFSRTILRRNFVNLNDELVLFVSTGNIIVTFISPNPASKRFREVFRFNYLLPFPLHLEVKISGLRAQIQVLSIYLICGL